MSSVPALGCANAPTASTAVNRTPIVRLRDFAHRISLLPLRENAAAVSYAGGDSFCRSARVVS